MFYGKAGAFGARQLAISDQCMFPACRCFHKPIAADALEYKKLTAA